MYVFTKHRQASVSSTETGRHREPRPSQEVTEKVGPVLRTQAAGLANKQAEEEPHQ